MGVLQGGAHLAGDDQDFVQIVRPADVKRFAFDQLHHNEGSCALKPRQIHLAGIVDGDDVGMVELRQRPRLALESRQAIGIAGHVVG